MWVFRKIRRVRRRPINRAEYLKYKEQTRFLVARKIHEFNSHYNYNVGRVTIRNQRSRWGSCSKRGNLNFNYRLALISDDFVDYVIVHELCHLGEFNHSKDFWNLVAQKIPQYAELRKKLHKIKF